MTKEEVLNKLAGKTYKDNADDNSISCGWKSKYRYINTNVTVDGDSVDLIIYFDKDNILTITSVAGSAPAGGTRIYN